MSTRNIVSTALAVVILGALTLITGIILLCIAVGRKDDPYGHVLFITVLGHILCVIGGLALCVTVIGCLCYCSISSPATFRSTLTSEVASGSQLTKVNPRRPGLGSRRLVTMSTSTPDQGQRKFQEEGAMQMLAGDCVPDEFDRKFPSGASVNWSNSYPASGRMALPDPTPVMSSALSLPSNPTSSVASVTSNFIIPPSLLKPNSSAFNDHPLHSTGYIA